eukprot:gene18385-25903_t
MPSMMTSTAAWLERSRSVSSMRKMKSPPVARANAQGYSAERILPRWMKPVGDGAKRVRMRPVLVAVVSVITINAGPPWGQFKLGSIRRAQPDPARASRAQPGAQHRVRWSAVAAQALGYASCALGKARREVSSSPSSAPI